MYCLVGWLLWLSKAGATTTEQDIKVQVSCLDSQMFTVQITHEHQPFVAYVQTSVCVKN